MKTYWKIIIIGVIVVVIVISSLFLQPRIKNALSDCKNYKPNFNDTDNDGRVTPCPEGCSLGSCYGMRTSCCPA
ncbi:MAG: hypothetical protein ACP5OA_07015 [Candidatus Woesearchaeota archaeon]